MSTARGQSESLNGIQYLRGVAALMVVVHHARHYYGTVPTWSNFGSAGVDIFFIISGFIMVHATRNFDPALNRRLQALDFFARRAIRIIPLYWLALLIQNRHTLRRGTTDPSVAYDFAFIPRFSESYPGEIYPSLIVGWTLNFEIFFYILFGASIIFGSRKYLVLVCTILLLVTVGQIWKLDSAPWRIWTGSMLGEFALGVGVYIVFAQKKWVPHTNISAALLVVGFILLALPNGPVPRLIADGTISALIVWSGLHVGRALKPQKILTILGDASYSIYLTHVFVLPYCYKIFNRLNLSEPTPTNIVFVLAACVIACSIVGVIIYYVVEKPLLKKMTALWRHIGQPSQSALARKASQPSA
ncbi:acyltransferase [Pseudorhodoferax sp. Leaf267]|uniref:acyltransferase family protein n=1 Tax=Pseudorhodoferax sp. Leaf267 TaxID=1736316 RepID=UPI0009EC4057|nr:acyltransferase [Pseudorhodoferax sp. Leaf267]